MQIVLTREEYNELLPNKLNNRFVEIFTDVMKNRQQFENDNNMLVEKLKTIFDDFQKEKEEDIFPQREARKYLP